MSETVSLFVGADIHAMDGESRLKEVLSLVKSDPAATQPQAVLLGGDHAGAAGGKNGLGPLRGAPGIPLEKRMDAEQRRRWQPEFSLHALRQEVCGVLGESVRTYFTYGSHDKNALGGNRDFFHGPASLGHYHLYGVSFCQMRFADGLQLAEADYDGPDAELGGADQGAAAFLAWEAALTDCKPIFVMSHIPLHVNRADNRGAAVWAEAFNEAARQHDIFVFFAHNHTAERRGDLDRQYYFVPIGQTMPVQGREQEEQRTISLAFTYLNAGYILSGCGTLLTLDPAEKKLTIRRYTTETKDQSFGDTTFPNPQIVSLR